VELQVYDGGTKSKVGINTMWPHPTKHTFISIYKYKLGYQMDSLVIVIWHLCQWNSLSLCVMCLKRSSFMQAIGF